MPVKLLLPVIANVPVPAVVSQNPAKPELVPPSVILPPPAVIVMAWFAAEKAMESLIVSKFVPLLVMPAVSVKPFEMPEGLITNAGAPAEKMMLPTLNVPGVIKLSVRMVPDAADGPKMRESLLWGGLFPRDQLAPFQ